MVNNKTKILFIGGHYNSAIATVDWLIKNTELTNENLVWAGHKYWNKKDTILELFKKNNPSAKKHSEYISITERNIDFKTILAGKIFRFKSFKYLLPFIFNILLIPVGFVNAFIILVSTKPKLIVSFGGFSAVPLVIVGKILRIRSITHEQTIVVGLANKVIEKFVDKIYTAWPVEYYPNQDIFKYEYIGLPMNPYLLDKVSETSIFDFQNALPTIMFTGGKAGSALFNNFLVSNINELSKKYNIIATIGKDENTYNRLQKFISHEKLTNVKVFEYLFQKEMASALKASDMVVTRAGAHTIYELCYLEKKSLIIPLQYTSMGEQNKNADIAAKNIPCIVIKNDEPADSDLLYAIERLNNLDLNLTFNSKIEFVDNASEKLSLQILKYVS